MFPPKYCTWLHLYSIFSFLNFKFPKKSVIDNRLPYVVPRFLRLNLVEEFFVGCTDDLHDASELIDVFKLYSLSIENNFFWFRHASPSALVEIYFTNSLVGWIGWDTRANHNKCRLRSTLKQFLKQTRILMNLFRQRYYGNSSFNAIVTLRCSRYVSQFPQDHFSSANSTLVRALAYKLRYPRKHWRSSPGKKALPEMSSARMQPTDQMSTGKGNIMLIAIY